jgi:hypothetical protein
LSEFFFYISHYLIYYLEARRKKKKKITISSLVSVGLKRLHYDLFYGRDLQKIIMSEEYDTGNLPNLEPLHFVPTYQNHELEQKSESMTLPRTYTTFKMIAPPGLNVFPIYV